MAAVEAALNNHFGIIYRNEQHMADMIVTTGVRVSVARRILREKLGVDDAAFEALITQEIARRKEEEEAAQKKAQRIAQEKTATEKAKELGAQMAKDYESTVEDINFGGDFGEERDVQGVGDEVGDQDQPGEDDGPGSGVVEGSVEETR
jgi:hypothetical protein